MLSRFSRLFLLTIVLLVFVTSLFVFHGPTRMYIDPLTGDLFGEGGVEKDLELGPWKVPATEGGVIMPKLGNETAKHTMTLRFPEKPTEDERNALDSYFRLQARLYPCGECAAEFQQLLNKFPPQTSSRRAASLWLCRVHNEVNQRLGKPEFDCAHLDSEYDCGCGDTPIGKSALDDDVTQEGQIDDELSDQDDLTGVALIKGGR